MLNIRKIVNNNKLYAWMAITILLIQSYAIAGRSLAAKEKSVPEERVDFAQEIKANRQLLQKALAENPQVATNFAYVSFFMLIILLLGVIFLGNFVFVKVKGKEPVPRTLEEYAVAWSWEDALKIAIIFLFFSHIFFIFEHLLTGFLGTAGIDKRSSIVVDSVFMDIFVLLLVIRFAVVKYKQKIAALGISFKNIAKDIGIALYGYLAFLPVLAGIFFCVLVVAKLLNYTPPAEPIYELVFKERRPHLLVVISLMVALIGPVVEEIFFRGFLYSALKKRLNVTAAMVVSACIFSLLHTNVLGFLPIVFLGIFLAYLREKTGSLIPSITVHMVHNAALTALMFLAKYAVSLTV